MSLAPIVLFVYNRPQHALKTLEALAINDLAKESILYIFADGPKENASSEEVHKINQTRDIIKAKSWCKSVSIIESSTNLGLATSIVKGVTSIIKKYDKVIVLEDDIVTSPGFLSYMNQALTLYATDSKVMHISGYLPLTTGAHKLPETFFLRYMSCWGWATWRRSWDKCIYDVAVLKEQIMKRSDFKAFDLEGCVSIYKQIEQNITGEINTWAVKWYATIFLKDGLCLYPRASLVQQIGIDGSGTHCDSDKEDKYSVFLASSIQVDKVKIEESKQGKLYLKRFYKFGKDSSLSIRARYLKNNALNPIIRILKNY